MLDFQKSRKELEALQLIRKCLGQANLEIYKCMHRSRKGEIPSQYLDEALDHYPHCSEANYEKGLRHIQSDEKEDAKARFEKSLEADGIIGLPTWNWQILQRMKASGKG